MTTEDHVRHEVDGRLSRIVLDRPEAANRIHSTMMRQLIDALAAATAAGSDVVLITAAGRDFSVGRDQHEALPDGFSKLDNTRLIVDANRLLTGFPGITVAAAQGRALGFGCGVVVQSDIALAAASAELGFDEVHHGTAPAFVMSYLEEHVGPKRALDLIVTGRTLSAAEIAAIREPILEEYTRRSSGYYSTSELWDDGLLDPVDTRNALGIAITCSLNTPIAEPGYGVFRF